MQRSICALSFTVGIWLGAVVQPTLGATTHVELVRQGRARAVVVIPGDASPTTAYAAKELVEHIELATGARLEIVTETQAAGGALNRIFLGPTAAARALGINCDALAPDEYLLRSQGDNFFICGRDDGAASPTSESNNRRGTLFGTYEVLQRFVGIRWLWPGALGTYVPTLADLKLPAIDERQAPRLKVRRLRWQNVQSAARRYPAELKRLAYSPAVLQSYHRDLEAYLARHRTGLTENKPKVGHKFSGWWKKYGKEHPEWFCLDKEGRRGVPQDANIRDLTHVSMCVSNPDLHRFIVEEHWDGGDTLSLGEVDRRIFCHCEKCLAWDAPQPENPPKFASSGYRPRWVTDRYARFWKTVYDLAVKRNPKVQVTSFLYWNYMPAPAGEIQLGKGFYGEFVPWGNRLAYYPMSAEEDQWLREQWLGWERSGITLAYRPNNLHGGYVMPFLSTRQAGEFFRFAYRHGMWGCDFDSLYGHWSTRGPMLYIYMRLIDNPELDIEDLRTEYFAAFGSAAPIVERYFDYWEDYSLGVRDTLFSPVTAHKSFPEKVFPPAQMIMAEALAAVRADGSPDEIQRVEFLKAGLEHALLASRFTSFLNYGPMKNFGAIAQVKYDPIPIQNRERFEACRRALKEMLAFRRAHESLYICDYLDAAKRESRRIDIETLLGER